jgi:hypothetical protein
MESVLKIVNEETLSSESGIHFGHYIVGCKSDIIVHYHAARVSVILAHAIQLERWSWGLSVMLEKTLGNTLDTKLRAILLMEADFDATNKIVYRNRMLYNVQEYKQMLEEIFSKKNAWQMMAPSAKFCSTISPNKRESQPPLHWWMHRTAMTGLHMQLHP